MSSFKKVSIWWLVAFGAYSVLASRAVILLQKKVNNPLVVRCDS